MSDEPAAQLPADDSLFDTMADTSQVALPKDPLARVIGQDEAVRLARVCALQRRHLLLVGPPGTGKSMIAQALALHLPPPRTEVLVAHNPEAPERPFVESRPLQDALLQRERVAGAAGELVEPSQVPIKVAEQLGYRCARCSSYSPPTETQCPQCNAPKGTLASEGQPNNPFSDLLGGIVQVTVNQLGGGRDRVTTTRRVGGKEEVVVYARAGDRIRLYDEKALERKREIERLSPHKVLLSIDRKSFVLATGASETELLGDVRHDPYGGHPQLGTQPYERVVPGAIHEAHEGVLFVDELPHLGHLQRQLLTAMQERAFPIAGRHPQSAGASVKVDNVPCDFIFVAACNITDLQAILAPLRSRILGNGYEVLVATTMPDTPSNRVRLAQFVAQEIAMDGRIPHATVETVRALCQEAASRAKEADGIESVLTLRLRELGGLVRIAGDIAKGDDAPLITPRHLAQAITVAKPVEQQIKDRYGSYYAGLARDLSSAQRSGTSPYNYWDSHINDDKMGYE